MRPRLPDLAECRDCHEPIRFVRMRDTGKLLPVNPKPNPELGNRPSIVAAHLSGRRLIGFVISADKAAGPFDPYRFTAHFATCEARKPPPPKPPAPPAATLFDQ